MTKGPAQQVGVFALFLLIWAAATMFGGISPSTLPPVTDVAKALVSLWWDPAFLPSVLLTMRDAFAGLMIATVLGIGAGVVIGTTPWLERSTRLLVDFGRSFPQIALLPIFMMFFGATSTMKIILVSIACFFPVLLQTIYGARRLDETMADTVRAYRLPLYLRVWKVTIPSASPFIFTGFRIALIVSILVSIGVEILSQVKGMGRELALSRSFYRTDIAFAYAIYAGLLGVLVNAAADRLEAMLLGWHLRAERE